LHEISLVTFPAYTETNVRDKNNDAYIPKPPDKPIPVDNDGFEDRTNEYKRKIQYLKIKNK
ncbi:HK97 family phage prohead protease, partial [Brachyspira hampsonii]|nr:HK97 family phage prohead protease [Brachyspira hampsonii]